VAGGGSSAVGVGAGSSAVGGSCVGGGDGSSAVGGGSSVDGGGAEGPAAVGDDVGASVVVGASLVPAEDGEGVEDAGCDVGAPSEAEEDSPPRVGAAELLLLAGPLDGLAATSMALPDGQGVAELAAAIPSRKLRRMGFSS
jgi:hypothetical protein